MSHTTELMKDVANIIAREITEQGKKFGCVECSVNDFGRFGNFSLICYLNMERSSSYRQTTYKPKDIHSVNLTLLVNTIKRVIKSHEQTGAKKRSHECPVGIYSKQRIRNFTESYFEGYDKNYILIDLDFIPYHAESNTFATQLPFTERVEPFIVENQKSRKGEQLTMF